MKKTVSNVKKLGSSETKFLGVQLRFWTGLAALFTIIGVVIGVVVPIVQGNKSVSGSNTGVSSANSPQITAVSPSITVLPYSPGNNLQESISAPPPSNSTNRYCFDGKAWCSRTNACYSNSTVYNNITECCSALDVSRNICIKNDTSAYPNCDNTFISNPNFYKLVTVEQCTNGNCMSNSCPLRFDKDDCNPLSPGSSSYNDKGVFTNMYTCCYTYSTNASRCGNYQYYYIYNQCRLMGLNYTKCP